MVALSQKTFLGQIPTMHPTLLPEQNCQTMLDVWVYNGVLQGIKNALQDATGVSASANTLYRYRPTPTNPANAYWLTLTDDLNVAPSPIANDAYGRLFFSKRDGSTAPSFGDSITLTAGTPTYPYTLGLPTPAAPVAVVTDGFGALAYSSDTGATWNAPVGFGAGTTPFNAIYYASAAATPTWIACGNNGQLATSTDGVNWAMVTIPTDTISPDPAGLNFLSATYGITSTNACFLVTTHNGRVLYSPDAVTWNLVPASGASPKITSAGTALYTSLFFDGKLYVAGAKGRIWYKVWGATTNLATDAWAEVTAGASGSYTLANYFQPAGANYDIRCAATNGTVAYFAGAGGKIVVRNLGASGAGRTQWDACTGGGGVTYTAMAYDGTTMFAAVGEKAYATVMSGGTGWTRTRVADIPALSKIMKDSTLRGVTYTALGQPVFVGSKGKIAIGGSGGVWTAPTSTSADFGENQLNGVAYGGGKLLAVGTPPQGVAETRFYVVTFVDAYGSEGPPSPVSNEIVIGPSQTVTVTWSHPTLTGVNTTGGKYYLYRTSTSGNGTAFLYTGTLAYNAGATPSFLDTVATASLQDPVPSTDWAAPPSGLRGLVSFPGGFLAGFVNNSLWFSEPGQPHAWPVKYMLSVDYPIVGLSAFGNSLLVATTGQPYLVQGVDPANMVPTKLETAQACVSAKSIVDLGQQAVYASARGLVAVSPQGATDLTRGLFTRDQWQQLQPSTMRAYPWEGGYLVSFSGSGDFIPAGAQSMLIIPNEAAQTAGVMFYSATMRAGFYDLYEDRLYYLSGTTRYVWNAGTTRASFTWKSRLMQTSDYIGFSWLEVQPDAFPVTAQYYADGELRATYTWNSSPSTGVYNITVTTPGNSPVTADFSQLAVRLPTGRPVQFHEIVLTGNVLVRQVTLAQSVQELKSV